MLSRFLAGLLILVGLLLALVVPAEAATRFWVGGTGTWDNASTAHWSASTGGAGGQSVPGSSDTATFDASSGGGTVTVSDPNGGGTVTLSGLTFGAFTGTLDFATNNNNVTVSGSTGVSGTGSGVRTFNAGSGTWTLTAGGAGWNFTTTTNLTISAASANIVLSLSSNQNISFSGGSKTYGSLTLTKSTTGSVIITGSNTFTTFTVNPGTLIQFTNATTQTATNFSASCTSTQPCSFGTQAAGNQATISVASGTINMTYLLGIRDMTFTGGATFTAANSIDYGQNSGVTITAPSFGGGGGIIGGR